MPSFFLAEIEVLDPKKYQEYVEIKHLREQSTKSRAVIIAQDADANMPDAGDGK